MRQDPAEHSPAARRPTVAAALSLALATAVSPTAWAGGDPAKGADVYDKCIACHSPSLNRIGPRHQGVVGRTAGGLTDFAYSPALKKAGFVWDEARLDQWLTNPEKLVPGNRMGFRLQDPAQRADVIAYLKTLK